MSDDHSVHTKAVRQIFMANGYKFAMGFAFQPEKEHLISLPLQESKGILITRYREGYIAGHAYKGSSAEAKRLRVYKGLQWWPTARDSG
eukprot:982814-Pelagomonas_calceolata.AAC.1